MRRRFGSRVAFTSLAVSVVIGMLSVTSGAGVPATTGGFLPPIRKGPAPATIKIGLSGGYAINFLPTEVAMGGGYFKQVANRFHTNIVFDVYGAGSLAEAAFLSGTDQFSVVAESNALPGILAGKDQLGLIGGGIALGIVMTAAQRLKSTKGTTISNFGPPTKWCQISPNGTSDAASRLEAAENGLNISQLNLTSIGSVAAVLPTLQAGTCDLTSGDVNSAANGIISGTVYPAANLETPQSTIALAGEFSPNPLQTSYAFAHQYPQLTQSIVDAELESLRFIQTHLKNSEAIYRELPAAMKSGLPIGSFAEAMTLIGPLFPANVMSGEFSTSLMADTVLLVEATGSIPVSSVVNPAHVWSNKYIIQAYKDLHLPAPAKDLTGPSVIPQTLGEPSLEAATAFSLLTGQPAPANTGKSPLLGVKSS